MKNLKDILEGETLHIFTTQSIMPPKYRGPSTFNSVTLVKPDGSPLQAGDLQPGDVVTVDWKTGVIHDVERYKTRTERRRARRQKKKGQKKS